jgi:hypothetical protein
VFKGQTAVIKYAGWRRRRIWKVPVGLVDRVARILGVHEGGADKELAGGRLAAGMVVEVGVVPVRGSLVANAAQSKPDIEACILSLASSLNSRATHQFTIELHVFVCWEEYKKRMLLVSTYSRVVYTFYAMNIGSSVNKHFKR